jgi:glyoxylase-like metal-dependent hydrolase (beta-lactamase superfamily II)
VVLGPDDEVGETVAVHASEVQSRAWATRTAPAPDRVIPGLWAIGLPAEGSPIGYTLDYLFETSDGGVALVDTGWSTDSSYDALVASLDALGHTLADLHTVIVTHMHPDHLGLVPRLLAESPGLRLLMHDADLRLVDERAEDLRIANHELWVGLMASVGAPDELEITRRIPAAIRLGAELRGQIVALADGESVELEPWTLETVWTPGHTPGHLCFEVTGHALFITGDHILPTITPQISQLSDPDQDVLGTYLGSLASVRDRAADTVLPAHQFRFTGLAERVDELLAHHERRLGLLETAIAIAPGSTCWQLAHVLDWREPIDEMPVAQARMAVKETLTHLLHLLAIGRVARDETVPAGWWPRAGMPSEAAA